MACGVWRRRQGSGGRCPVDCVDLSPHPGTSHATYSPILQIAKKKSQREIHVRMKDHGNLCDEKYALRYLVITLPQPLRL